MRSDDQAAQAAEAFGADEVTIAPPVQNPPPKAYSAVFRALGRLWDRLDVLRRARAAERVGKIDNLAEDCVHHWLIAQAARRRLEKTPAQDWVVESAQNAVDSAARMLQPQLQTMRHLPARTRRHLARLRLSMKLVVDDRERGRIK